MTSRTALDLLRPDRPARALVRLRVGFIPLVDCAPLVVARDLGFAAAEGLELDLVRETSWANIRDRIVLGHFDAAHMLAPMAIAARLGLGPLAAPIIAPFVMNHGGNAVSLARHVEIDPTAWSGIADPLAAGRALADVVAARARAGAPPLTLAHVHPFSCHNYQLRYWLAAVGLDPDRDLRLVVVPPPYMVDALESGVVDGCCVGAPWSSLAVEAGVGRIVLSTGPIWTSTPEKVLGVRETFAERRPDDLAALLRALDAAAAWAEDPANHADLAALLARPEVIGVDAEVIGRSLSGRLVAARGEPALDVPGFLRFHGPGPAGPINRPRAADGLWLAAQILRWNRITDRAAALDAARTAFSPAHWDAAIGPAEPDGAVETVVPFDGAVFDAAAPDAWIDTHPGPAAEAGAEGL